MFKLRKDNQLIIDQLSIGPHDVDVLARHISAKIKKYTYVYNASKDSANLCYALNQLSGNHTGPILIVDIVYHDYDNMEFARKIFSSRLDVIGIIIFALAECPDWIWPIFSYQSPKF